MENKEEKWLREEKYGGLESDAYRMDLARLRAGEPVAYVIGHIPFLGLSIQLDSKPLIPRPETEWWTEKLIVRIKERIGRTQGAISVLDLCAGSGAIGLSVLAHVPEALVTFAEADPAHDATIRKNMKANGIDESRARVCTGDLFAPLADRTFDIIATNPPYIPSGRALDVSVTDHEPHLALFSGNDGLDLVRRIKENAPTHMNPDGELWMEVDSEHADEARSLVAQSFSRAELIPDQYGRPRLVVGYL